MKTPGGARDALAGGAHRADGGHDDGSELRALRAVWLEMRDEEPSNRGLADLLAAARAKAEMMQVRPTLWQRLVGGFGRPPALALATVMVLVGGAVVLGRRGLDGAEVPRAPGAAPGATPGATDRMTGTPVAQPARPVGGPGAAGYVASADRLAKPGPGNAGAAPKAGLVTAAPDLAPAAPVVRLAKEAPAPRVADARAADPLAAGNDGILRSRPRHLPAPEAASANASRDARPAEATRPQAGVADDADAPRPAPGGRPTSDAARSTSDVDRVESSAEASDPQPAPPAVPPAQLYQQCESAARRGDCAAVRLMVGRITKTDRSYRARVAKDSPVAKCLAE